MSKLSYEDKIKIYSKNKSDELQIWFSENIM